jgi:hypothetical protein
LRSKAEFKNWGWKNSFESNNRHGLSLSHFSFLDSEFLVLPDILIVNCCARRPARLKTPRDFCRHDGKDDGSERAARAAQDLAWALINSPAFLFNH